MNKNGLLTVTEKIFVLLLIISLLFLYFYPTKTVFNLRTPQRATTKDVTIINVTKKAVPKIIDPYSCLEYDTLLKDTPEDITNIYVRADKSIFLFETSCRSSEVGRVMLNSRQACAVESAALMNPTRDVRVLILSPAPLGKPQSPLIQAIVKNYGNVRILHANIRRFLKDTPTQRLYTEKIIHKSKWPIAHLSDILRFVVLWKYGGIYLDLDVISIRSLDDLTVNFSGVETINQVAAGVIGFDSKNEGHQWVNDILINLNATYNPNNWSYNSLGVLQGMLYKLCNTMKVPDMTKEKCKGFKLYGYRVFYPLTYWEWQKIFKTANTKELIKRFENPEMKTVHLWNKLSSEMHTENGSALLLLAEKYCPHVYAANKNEF